MLHSSHNEQCGTVIKGWTGEWWRSCSNSVSFVSCRTWAITLPFWVSSACHKVVTVVPALVGTIFLVESFSNDSMYWDSWKDLVRLWVCTQNFCCIHRAGVSLQNWHSNQFQDGAEIAAGGPFIENHGPRRSHEYGKRGLICEKWCFLRADSCWLSNNHQSYQWNMALFKTVVSRQCWLPVQ